MYLKDIQQINNFFIGVSYMTDPEIMTLRRENVMNNKNHAFGVCRFRFSVKRLLRTSEFLFIFLVDFFSSSTKSEQNL